jgi:adenosylcobinamide amidohydrolase
MKGVHYYPCQLTNLTSVHPGYFSSWLSADMYPDAYGDPDNFVAPNAITSRTKVDLKGISYVESAEVLEYKLYDFPHRTLLIRFKSPQGVLSSGDGAWSQVTAIGNSGSPPMAWSIRHKNGWDKAQDMLFEAIQSDRKTTSLIFTGADIRALSVKSASYKGLTVHALATAGVDGNALRTSRDKGEYYDPGTINIILLSSRNLSMGGAASAAIVMTEAKTAALWDMDIRSAETPKVNPATGTGTDDLIVVAGGDGPPLDYTGGHSKIGELIARVVYDAVAEALLRQNGKAPVRPVWLRLVERGILVEDLGPDFRGEGPMKGFKDAFMLLMLEPRAQALLEAAFSLDDARVMGEFTGDRSFSDFAAAEAARLAGRGAVPIRGLVTDKSVPPNLTSALNALGSALLARNGH